MVPTNLVTDQGGVLSDLYDWLHLYPGQGIHVADAAGKCDTLTTCPVAWHFQVDGGVSGVIWARIMGSVEECASEVFEQLRNLGILHNDTSVPLSTVSNDGFLTPIVSPRQFCTGTIRVPGPFRIDRGTNRPSARHPDCSSDMSDAARVFDFFRSHKSGKRIRDRTEWGT